MLIKHNIIKHVDLYFCSLSSRLLSSILKLPLFKTIEEWLNNFNIRYGKKLFDRAISLEWIILLLIYEIF